MIRFNIYNLCCIRLSAYQLLVKWTKTGKLLSQLKKLTFFKDPIESLSFCSLEKLANFILAMPYHKIVHPSDKELKFSIGHLPPWWIMPTDRVMLFPWNFHLKYYQFLFLLVFLGGYGTLRLGKQQTFFYLSWSCILCQAASGA